jgi:hypothetical protein
VKTLSSNESKSAPIANAREKEGPAILVDRVNPVNLVSALALSTLIHFRQCFSHLADSILFTYHGNWFDTVGQIVCLLLETILNTAESIQT